MDDGENVSLDRWAVNFMQMTYARGLVVVVVVIVIVIVIVVVVVVAAAFNQQMRDNTRNYVPYSFRTVCGFFYVPQKLIMKSCETGPTV